MIAIVDYGAGNIQSVVNALNKFDVDYCLAKKEKTLLNADGIILPGVGAYGAAVDKLNSSGLYEGVRNAAAKGIPLFGICLGMQLLFSGSEESPGKTGLSLIEGTVKRLQSGGKKIPHIGWTSLTDLNGSLFKDTEENEFMYFVHSFACIAANPRESAAKTEYGQSYDAAIEKGNIFGCQFHPEKSSLAGLKIVYNFLKIAGEV